MSIAANLLSYIHQDGRIQSTTALCIDGTNRIRFKNAAVSCTKSAAQTGLTLGAWTTITFNTDDFDTDTLHDTGSNTSRLTAQIAGKYLVTATAFIDTTNITSATITGVRVIKNGGTSTIYSDLVVSAASGTTTVLTTSVIVSLAAGDYVEMQTFGNGSAGSYDVQEDNGVTRFGMVYVGE